MKRAAFGLALFVLPACHHTLRPCAPGTPAKVELRDGAGALALALKPAPEGSALDLCDGNGARIGQLVAEGQTITALDQQGALALRLVSSSPDDAQGTGPHGPRLRIHRGLGALRVLRPDGVPFGTIVESGVESGASTVVTDAASRPLATLSARGGDEVVTRPDGTTSALVVHPASASAAAAFALPELSLPERSALYLLWSR